jgi:alkylmercury lyase
LTPYDERHEVTMPDSIDTIANDVGDSLLGNESLTDDAALFTTLLRLLAAGSPVTLEEAATTAGRSPEQVREALASRGDVELDEQGRIVGYGITLRATPHRFEVEGRQLYTWCALDTLMFPRLLGTSARVESPSHGNGAAIRVEVEPDRVVRVDPPGAVVSLVTPDAPQSVRMSFCNQVHFFADQDDASSWLVEHPEATVVSVADAYEIGRRLADAMLEGAPDNCC